MSSTKREIRQRNVHKIVQSCCFTNRSYCFLWRSRCRPRRWILKSLMDPFAQLFQLDKGNARSLHVVFKVLCVVFFPKCSAGPNIIVGNSLGNVASVCTPLPTLMQTTPRVFGLIMFGIVASVCT